jgi:hypothetical protein
MWPREVEPKRGISIYGHERWNLNVAYRYMACRYMAIDRWNLSSSPSCGKAVRGSMKFGKKIRAAEVNGRFPRVGMVTIAFPVDEVLGLLAMEEVSN